MAKLSGKLNGIDIVSKNFYIEIRIEKIAEVRTRFFFTRILMWLLRKIAPCKVEMKYYEQNGNRNENSGSQGRVKRCKRD